MELEIIKTVLTDLLEEQKTTNQLNQEVSKIEGAGGKGKRL